MDGATPLFTACVRGLTSTVRLLLAAAPQAACMLVGQTNQQGPLHSAVAMRRLDIVRLILKAAPHAARVRCSGGCLPIHHAAADTTYACSAAMVQLLLDAAPGTAMGTCGEYTPLLLAALHGNAAAARVLARAAPGGALAALQVALVRIGPAAAGGDAQPGLQARLDTARALLAAVPPAESLPLLAARGDSCLPLLPAVAMHCQLTAAQWQQVPALCPGLGHALPAVLQRSEAEAALLVARLAPADKQRLRTFALVLHRTQCRLTADLPAELVRRVLSLCAC